MISFSDSPKLMTALAAVTVVLAAANLRSLRQRALTDAAMTTTPRPPRQAPPVTPPELPAKVIPAAPIPAMSFDPGLEVEALLDRSVELLCDDRTEHVPFRRTLPRGELRVVNLWNIHCRPCFEEFPQLADVLASAPKLAKFVAVNTHESTDPHISYRDPRAKGMPTPDARLTERLASPIFDEALRIAEQQLGLKSNEGGLPITFVIDCRQRLRWLKTGKLTAQDTAELTQLLTRLADDGCTSAPRLSVTESVCDPPPPPPLLKEIKSRKDCARCKTGMCKETRRGRLVCDDSNLIK